MSDLPKVPEKVERIITDNHFTHGGVGFPSANCGSCNKERLAIRRALADAEKRGRVTGLGLGMATPFCITEGAFAVDGACPIHKSDACLVTATGVPRALARERAATWREAARQVIDHASDKDWAGHNALLDHISKEFERRAAEAERSAKGEGK